MDTSPDVATVKEVSRLLRPPGEIALPPITAEALRTCLDEEELQGPAMHRALRNRTFLMSEAVTKPGKRKDGPEACKRRSKRGYRPVTGKRLAFYRKSGMRFQRDAWLNSGDSTKRRTI